MRHCHVQSLVKPQLQSFFYVLLFNANTIQWIDNALEGESWLAWLGNSIGARTAYNKVLLRPAVAITVAVSRAGCRIAVLAGHWQHGVRQLPEQAAVQHHPAVHEMLH